MNKIPWKGSVYCSLGK